MGSQGPLMLATLPTWRQTPNFWTHKTIKTRLINIKVESWVSHIKSLQDCVWELGLAFCLAQLSTQVPTLTSKKWCHVDIHVILGPEDSGVVWKGKSQLRCSQRLRLHGSTSRDLQPRTLAPMWTGPNFPPPPSIREAHPLWIIKSKAMIREIFGHKRLRS